jgi:hypothetical protein
MEGSQLLNNRAYWVSCRMLARSARKVALPTPSSPAESSRTAVACTTGSCGQARAARRSARVERGARRRRPSWWPVREGRRAAPPSARSHVLHRRHRPRSRALRFAGRCGRLVVMAVLMVLVGAVLRIERRLHRRQPGPQPALLEHVVAANAHRAADHLHVGMTIADMPREPRETRAQKPR